MSQDPRLDFSSPQFDAAFALKSDLEVQGTPADTIELLVASFANNVEGFEKRHNQAVKLLRTNSSKLNPNAKEERQKVYEERSNRHLQIKQKATDWIETILTKTKRYKGPLTSLADVALEGKKVIAELRVTRSRDSTDTRKVIVGRLVLIDYHWNLVLQDVVEEILDAHRKIIKRRKIGFAIYKGNTIMTISEAS